MPSTGSAPLLDERVATWAARAVILGTAPGRDDPSAAARLRAEVAADLPAIDQAARDWAQLGTELSPTTVRVVGRLGWVQANLAGLRGAFEPLRDRLGARRHLTARALGLQVGALFGLLSSKVLGQYVLPLGRRDDGDVQGPGGGGELLVVGPNVLALAADRPELAADVRRTVLLHEVTHRLQFEGAPWLAPHLQGLLDRYLGDARLDRSAVLDVAADLPGALAAARRTGDVRPLVEVVLTDTQREVLDEAQGLMSLLEGHGTAAMYGATDGVVDDPPAVRDHLASRRGDVTSRVLDTVGGMQMKRRQYAEGERFVDTVLARAGVTGLNRAFEAADRLPRADEVTDPERWLARVAGG